MYSDFDYKIKIVATNLIDFISNNWVGIVYKCLLLKLKPFPIPLKKSGKCLQSILNAFIEFIDRMIRYRLIHT